MGLYDAVNMLDQIGVLDIILPFMLIFTVVYAILQQTNILGEGKKNFNITIAFVMGLGVVIPHVTGSYRGVDPVVLINSALPNVAVWIVAILMLLILIGVLGLKRDNMLEIKWAQTAVVFVAIAVVAFIFLNSAGIIYDIPFISNPDVQALLLILLVFGLIVYFVTSDSSTASSGGE